MTLIFEAKYSEITFNLKENQQSGAIKNTQAMV